MINTTMQLSNNGIKFFKKSFILTLIYKAIKKEKMFLVNEILINIDMFRKQATF